MIKKNNKCYGFCKHKTCLFFFHRRDMMNCSWKRTFASRSSQVIRHLSSIRYLQQQRLKQTVLKTVFFLYAHTHTSNYFTRLVILSSIALNTDASPSFCQTRGITVIKKTSGRRSPRPPGNFQKEVKQFYHLCRCR